MGEGKTCVVIYVRVDAGLREIVENLEFVKVRGKLQLPGLRSIFGKNRFCLGILVQEQYFFPDAVWVVFSVKIEQSQKGKPQKRLVRRSWRRFF